MTSEELASLIWSVTTKQQNPPVPNLTRRRMSLRFYVHHRAGDEETTVVIRWHRQDHGAVADLVQRFGECE